MAKKPARVFTIGHSNRTLEDFIGLLKAHSVQTLVDVRTIPRSRHNPQFNIETLPKEMEKEGMGYVHMKGLGGLRRAMKDSPNTGWRNTSFRGFADYMLTEEFRVSLDGLIALAEKERVAVMCAESLQWRCHRSLIADSLLVRGVKAFHITSKTKAEPHRLTPFAKEEQGRLVYPPEKANG